MTAAYLFGVLALVRLAAQAPARGIVGALAMLPPLLLAVWAGVNIRISQVIAAVVVLQADPGVSLKALFAPAALVIVAAVVAGLVRPGIRKRLGFGWAGALALAPAVFVLSLVAWGGAVSGAQTAWLSRSPLVNAKPDATTTLAYCRPGGAPLAMDITQPPLRPVYPPDSPPTWLPARGRPVVLYIHGGETLLGTRVLDDGGVDGPYFVKLRTRLVSAGFVVTAIDYRLAPFQHVPDQIADVQCAVQFLRANADALGIDPARIGVFGPSQGGYLSAMVGLLGDGAEKPEPVARPHGVQAVVDMWGPADLADFSGSPAWVGAISGAGAHPTAAMQGRLRAVSPLYHVAPGAPPFLIIHGDDDWFIAPHHSRDLAARLKAAGVDVTYVRVAHDGHGLAAASRGQAEQPGPDALVGAIAGFFVRTLNAPPPPAAP